MNALVTSEQMKIAERYMINELGLPAIVLMEKAAERVFEVACSFCDVFAEGARVSVLCGCGNNGGDGLAVARMMHQRGVDVSVCIIGDENHATDEFILQKSIYEKLGGVIEEEPDYEATLIVDALLGIGIKGTVRGRYFEVIDELNATHKEIKNTVVSIDIPSGISADTGDALGIAVNSDITVCLGCDKVGLLLKDGPACAGQVITYDIGIEPPAECEAMKMEYDDIASIMPGRIPNSNKSTYGKITIVAGSKGMPGAAVLSTRASLTAGVGMVKLLTDESVIPTIVDIMPEVMVDTYSGFDAIDAAIDWCDCVLIGPGLGRDQPAEDVFLYVMKTVKECAKPIVIDADGLYHLSSHMELLSERGRGTIILTPHPGEFSRLFGTEIREGKHQDLAFLKENAAKYNVTILAKDYTSIITSCGLYENCAYISTFGTDALATAGTGDVLAGLVVTMLVNTDNPVDACLIGSCIHGLSGALASEESNDYAVTASDVVKNVPYAINSILGQNLV